MAQKSSAALGMALIVSCLMLISILFEHAQEAIREATGPEMRPVLDAMLSEMTLLGFIGLLMFVLEQSEFLDQLSERYYSDDGDDEEAEPVVNSTSYECDDDEDDDSVLSEVIEQVHMILFVVMILFFICTVAVTRRAMKSTAVWRVWEAEADEDESAADTTTTTARGRKDATGKSRYNLIRSAFVADPDHARLAKCGAPQMTEHFDFSLYSSILLGHQLAELVEVPVTAWASMWALFVVGWGLTEGALGLGSGPRGSYAFAWCAWGILIVASLVALDVKVNSIVAQLAEDARRQRAARSAARSSAAATSDAVDDDARRGDATFVPIIVEGGGGGGGGGGGLSERLIDAKDAERRREEDGSGGGDDDDASARHTSRWWFGRPDFVLALLRQCILSCGVYSAIAAINVMPALWKDGADAGCVALTLALLLPPVWLMATVPRLMRDFVLVAHCFEHKHKHTIAEVVRRQRAQLGLRALRLAYLLKRSADMRRAARRGGTAAALPNTAVSPRRRVHFHVSRALPAREREVLRTIFGHFDDDGTGTVTHDEFKQLLVRINLTSGEPGTPRGDGDGEAKSFAEADVSFEEDICQMLDEDGDGEVTFEEFADWAAEAEAEATAADTAEEIIEGMFKVVDEDDSGVITTSELRHFLRSFGIEMSTHDVQLILELADDNGDHTLDLEEFGIVVRTIIPGCPKRVTMHVPGGP